MKLEKKENHAVDRPAGPGGGHVDRHLPDACFPARRAGHEDEIRAAIKKANYCSVDADCGLSPSRRHFVEQLVNVREIPNIAYLQRRYFDWGGTCLVLEYSGIYDFRRRYCSSGKCVAPRIGELIVEPRPIPPTPADRLPSYDK